MSKRGTGLRDFLRGEFLRGSDSRQRVKFDPAVSRSTTTPYKLDPAAAKLFESIASKGCHRCHGTGIDSWRLHGSVADLCRCVHTKLPELQRVLEEEKKKLEEQIATEKNTPTKE